MPRAPLLSAAAVAELERMYGAEAPPPSFRQLAQHLRARRLVARPIDPRVVWRAVRKAFPAPATRRKGAG